MRTTSAVAKPCQGDSSEFYPITGSIYTDQWGTVVLPTISAADSRRIFFNWYQEPWSDLFSLPELDSGLVVPSFNPSDDPIASLNKAMAFLSIAFASRFLQTNNKLRNSSNPRNQATIQDGRGVNRQRAAGQARVVKCYNYQEEGHFARQCTKPKRPKNATWFKEKMLLSEALESGAYLGSRTNRPSLAIMGIKNIIQTTVISFFYPKESLTMEEMLNKSFDEGKREHEEMRAFIYDFQTTNELLFKERNNSLIELRFGGVTTRGEKTTIQDVYDNDTNVLPKEPLVVELEKPVGSNEVLTNDQPQMTSEPVVQPSNKVQTPPVPFPRRLRKEKEEAQQNKFLENLKQLHINLPFIEALAQMPKYAKFLKGTTRAMIDVYNKKITLRMGMMNEIFDVDQSIKRPTTKDDEYYGIDDLDDMINEEAQLQMKSLIHFYQGD
ncbi:putative reverse transcriptase domain-containing protein [Tanacetum coccineum]